MEGFREHLAKNKIEPLLGEWLCVIQVQPAKLQVEGAEATRYSVEVNYRSTTDEILNAAAKVVLGYVTAGIKQHGFHTKHVYTEKPVRILVSSRNWDDSTHTVVVSWNEKSKDFIISRGFYNKDRRTVSVQHSEKCSGDSAADITKQVFNLMHHLKSQPDLWKPVLKAVNLKRGPKS